MVEPLIAVQEGIPRSKRDHRHTAFRGARIGDEFEEFDRPSGVPSRLAQVLEDAASGFRQKDGGIAEANRDNGASSRVTLTGFVGHVA